MNPVPPDAGAVARPRRPSGLAAFLTLTTILGPALRNSPSPQLQRDLLNSALAELPIIGARLHDRLGVATFGNTVSFHR